MTTFSNNFLVKRLYFYFKRSLKLVSEGPINNNQDWILIMAWHRTDDKPLFKSGIALFADAYMRHSSTSIYAITIVNTMRAELDERHIADDILNTFWKKKSYFYLNITQVVPYDFICNKSASVQIMDRGRICDKPLPEPMISCSLTPYGVTRPQWIQLQLVVI